jgi:hypothetical protein
MQQPRFRTDAWRGSAGRGSGRPGAAGTGLEHERSGWPGGDHCAGHAVAYPGGQVGGQRGGDATPEPTPCQRWQAYLTVTGLWLAASK